jgi:ABC-type antimicrobial peptide transport system permease subunit
MAVGTIIAIGTARLLAGLLYGIGPGDSLVLALTGLILMATAGSAAWIPARRAVRIDPARALRDA